MPCWSIGKAVSFSYRDTQTFSPRKCLELRLICCCVEKSSLVHSIGVFFSSFFSSVRILCSLSVFLHFCFTFECVQFFVCVLVSLRMSKRMSTAVRICSSDCDEPFLVHFTDTHCVSNKCSNCAVHTYTMMLLTQINCTNNKLVSPLTTSFLSARSSCWERKMFCVPITIHIDCTFFLIRFSPSIALVIHSFLTFYDLA